MTIKQKIIFYVIALVGFTLTLIGIVSNIGIISSLDQSVFAFVQNLYGSFWDSMVIFVTKIGDPYSSLLIFILFSLLLYKAKRKQSFYILSIAMFFGTVLPQTIKTVVEKARPVSQMLAEQNYSFPSGHATISAIFILSVFFLLAPLIRNKFAKISVNFLAVIIFSAVALSRIYLSVHWTSDVIAGIFLGSACYVFSDLIVSLSKDRQTAC